MPSLTTLRPPGGITVFARGSNEDPYQWRDESVGDDPEDGTRRDCAPDVYRALAFAATHEDFRLWVALSRAAQQLVSIGHPDGYRLVEEAQSLREGKQEAWQEGFDAHRVLADRPLSADSAEEFVLLWRAYFLE